MTTAPTPAAPRPREGASGRFGLRPGAVLEPLVLLLVAAAGTLFVVLGLLGAVK